MARRLKDIKEIKIERPPRAKLSAEESLNERRSSISERRGSLPLFEKATVEVYLPVSFNLNGCNYLPSSHQQCVAR